MTPLLDVEEAWAQIAPLATPLPAERVPLVAALGRVAAEDGRSAVDLPPFDRSAMDGFAVRAADTATGRPLALAGSIAAGEVQAAELAAGTAVGITTGAALPPGADAVLRSESARVLDGEVTPEEALEAGRNVRYRGEDVQRGDVLAPAGSRLTVQTLTALASAGVGEVAVHRRARLALLVTGSELLPLGAPPEPGRIHESNGLTLRLLAEGEGARVTASERVADDFEATRAAVEAGLAGELLLVSGGVSVGEHDHVKAAFEACGVQEVFWRVRMRPGKPLWFGRRGDCLVFGLPGNPLSTVVGFLVFIAPALRRLHGEPQAAPRYRRARLAVPAAASDGRTTFLTARLEEADDGSLVASPTERQGSHMTGALGESHGFVKVPHSPGELTAGSLVEVLAL